MFGYFGPTFLKLQKHGSCGKKQGFTNTPWQMDVHTICIIMSYDKSLTLGCSKYRQLMEIASSLVIFSSTII
jgi:hypothetical protein